MAKIFENLDKEYSDREFSTIPDVTKYTHLIDWDGDHSICGLALGGSADVAYGKVTCPDCVLRINAVKKLKKGVDY